MSWNVQSALMALGTTGIIALTTFAYSAGERISVIEARLEYITNEISGTQQATENLSKASTDLARTTELMRYQMEQQQALYVEVRRSIELLKAEKHK
ncbi:methyl-accepting chemotaxis protein [Aeromonas hydrophila]|uniref:hypothetical protein n=1 Tax=Aeromonas TaxID=642 RepID=UPI001C5B0AD5|nr:MULTISPECIES: hypothetical protein [Aeromonas]MBW3783697.1 hypothetical protein [Aeromonas veronii]MCS3766595.1 methyl-accepting chemotaxis protein [Aeromonas hydrophila]